MHPQTWRNIAEIVFKHSLTLEVISLTN